ncbi:hypothetical protein Srut_55300 [Streptomyces rutgersensis]|nr:hypothetical protein Srut_55300 [Streptomyces rutgersensis]
MDDPGRPADPDLFSTMSTLRAMRRLKPDPVPGGLLERLVQAAVRGRAAPTRRAAGTWWRPTGR